MAGRKARSATETSPDKLRATVKADLDRFLQAGNRIVEVPAGATGQDEKNRSKHIVISRKDEA